ncbi:MAG: hypothetical protein HZA03_08235 [Nitrospinae bacterium]|nr:hypothetical protein [Nitrospinota bacterium]
MNMNTFSKALVALMVVSMVVTSGTAFAGETKHKKHEAKAEEKAAAPKEEKKAEEAKPAAAPAAAPAAKGK